MNSWKHFWTWQQPACAASDQERKNSLILQTPGWCLIKHVQCLNLERHHFHNWGRIDAIQQRHSKLIFTGWELGSIEFMWEIWKKSVHSSRIKTFWRKLVFFDFSTILVRKRKREKNIEQIFTHLVVKLNSIFFRICSWLGLGISGLKIYSSLMEIGRTNK
jgi:hypothetical protein